MEQWNTRDYHVGGEPVRVLTDGYRNLPGSTMAEKRAALMADGRVQCTIREPRGHAGMYAAVLTAPVSSASRLGVIFACNDRCFPMFCGHALLGSARAAVEAGMIPGLAQGENRFFLDVPSGTVEAVVTLRDGVVKEVSFVNQPCFVLAKQVEVSALGLTLPVDVVWSGSFMAYVSAEALGAPLSPAVIPRAMELGYAIDIALRELVPAFSHPLEPAFQLKNSGALVCFVTAAEGQGDVLRTRTLNIIDRNNYDRGAAGTATCGRLALLYDQGMVLPGQALHNYALTGRHYDAVLEGITTVGNHPAIIPRLTAETFPMGESTFCLAEDDPFPEGFL